MLAEMSARQYVEWIAHFELSAHEAEVASRQG
jgi:hypothetical protein